MKAIIESTLKEAYLYQSYMECEFITIINLILSSTCESDLRLYFSSKLKYFALGFGSNHMWVKQIDLINMKLFPDRLIFVEF